MCKRVLSLIDITHVRFSDYTERQTYRRGDTRVSTPLIPTLRVLNTQQDITAKPIFRKNWEQIDIFNLLFFYVKKITPTGETHIPVRLLYVQIQEYTHGSMQSWVNRIIRQWSAITIKYNYQYSWCNNRPYVCVYSSNNMEDLHGRSRNSYRGCIVGVDEVLKVIGGDAAYKVIKILNRWHRGVSGRPAGSE